MRANLDRWAEEEEDEEGFKYYDMGYASAVSYLLVILANWQFYTQPFRFFDVLTEEQRQNPSLGGTHDNVDDDVWSDTKSERQVVAYIYIYIVCHIDNI